MDIDYEGAAEIERAWREGLTPDPLLTVSEWSDRHRMLSSKASAEPGRWRTSRTPYLKAIMDCLSPTSPVERVVFMKAAQLGATEMGSNWIGYVIHHAPGPMMAVWPTVEMAKRNSKQRIDPLIEESAALAELIAPARSRDSGNTILAKEFRGGVLVMTGANSAVGLRSMPVRYLFLDEVDGYPLDVDGEGDAISLAEARTRTFARRKIFIVSTPTISGASAIEREYEASDQRRYFVPCPHCSHRQWLRFEQLRWDKNAPETAAYICESCDTAIAEHHKTWMLEHGEWRATVDEAGNEIQRTTGFHLSSLYSPVGWRAWRDIAAAWEAAVSKESGSAAAIKTFKNTELGETWVEEGETPDWQRLVERREDYRIGGVPLGGLLLVGGADVQKDRIEASVWAFGRGKEAWLVEHRVLMGDTAREQVWKRLAEMLDEHWTHVSGAAMPLARFALDTGFATQEAYAFVRASHDARVMPVKGVPRGAALIGTPTAVDVSRDGKRLRRGIKVFTVAVGIAKLELYNNLRKGSVVSEDGVTTTFPAGFVHLPKIDAEFIQQLCAEQLITRRDRNGFPVREWQKMRERNEALDCYVYARAAAAAAGLDRFEERHWRELERQLGVAPPGLKRLMADIERGQIDIVVVYKIDRLTRSLADFSKMVEVFERHGVSFVSVTQQFNTTTSMGRLMLNVLLSFAQFEREVTGERIRDKIAAAKRKGMWMGGVPTIGYDVVNRQLVINPDEAAVVRRMFEEMLTIGSPTQIAARLSDEGVTTKAWTTQDGRVRTGTRIDKKYIHKVLRNRIYLGELSNRGTWYPGAHQPIIEQELWDKVHAVLARNSHERGVDTKIRSRNDALLRGLLYAPSGERMYPTYSRKNGRKYQYYVSKSESRFGAPGKSYERLPAAEIEAAVVAQIRTVLTSPESIASVVRHIQNNGGQVDEASTVMAMARLNDVWDQLFPVERHRVANLMIERVDLVHTDEMQGIRVKWRELGWDAMIGEFAPRGVGGELLEVEA